MLFSNFKKFLLPGLTTLTLVALISCSPNQSETKPQASETTDVSQDEAPVRDIAVEDLAADALDASPVEIVEEPTSKSEQSAVTESPILKSDEKVIPPTIREIKFVEGSDYIIKFPDEQPKEPVLMEFFSYMCPHCFNFEPTLLRWKEQKPASVEFIKVPVTFGRSGSWELAARAYYIAQELNLEKQFSQVMFRKIHIENKPPIKESEIGALFLALGVSNKKFKQAANSFNVDSNLRKAEFLSKKYKVTGVPYFLINKKYETGKDSYESEQSLFRLWNNLPGKDFML